MPRLIIIALFTAVAAGTWDAWWHVALGRESFWSPPHLLLYSSVLLAISLGWFSWHKTKERLWRNLAIALVFVPLSAPFDEMWHRVFGEEAINSLMIMWSPPHLVLIGAILASFFFLLPLLKQEKNERARTLLGALVFAGAYSLLLFVVAPFEPLHVHQLLGFWGAGIVSLVLGGVLLAGQRWIGGFGAAFMIALVILGLESMSFSEQIAPILDITPHDHSQSWIIVFSALIPAAAIDLLYYKPLWLRGLVWGFLWGGILYGLSWIWFEPQFQYSTAEALQATVSAGIGGFAAGLIIHRIRK